MKIFFFLEGNKNCRVGTKKKKKKKKKKKNRVGRVSGNTGILFRPKLTNKDFPNMVLCLLSLLCFSYIIYCKLKRLKINISPYWENLLVNLVIKF